MPREAAPIPAALRPPVVPDVPRLALRPEEAARSLGVCERTLRDLSDGPPVVRLGRVVLYPIGPMAAWLADRARTAADGPTPVPDVSPADQSADGSGGE